MPSNPFRAALAAAALLLANGGAALAQAPGPLLSARLESARLRVFQYEVIPVALHIRASGVTLGKTFDLANLPDAHAMIRLTPYEELPAVRTAEGETLTETRRFRWDVMMVATGRVTLAPTLRVETLTRAVTPYAAQPWVGSLRAVDIAPLSFTVRPLPAAGRPTPFSGGVGSFGFECRLTPDRPTAGDLVTARFTLSGTGHLDRVSIPAFTNMPGFRVYAPRRVEPREPGRTFEQVLVPLRAGRVSVPARTLTWFDPSSDGGGYRSATRGPFVLEVAPEDEPLSRIDEPLPVAPANFLPLQGASAELARAAAEALARGDTDTVFNAYALACETRAPDAPLCHNIGEAFRLARRKGAAALYYRHALALEPRQAESRAALQLVTPVSPPAHRPTWRQRAGLILPGAWRRLAVVALGLATLATALRRPVTRRAALTGVACAAVAVACIAAAAVAAHDLSRLGVMVAADTLRIAPGEGAAAPAGEVREAAAVRIVQTWEGWARIVAGSSEGWVRAASVRLVRSAGDGACLPRLSAGPPR